MMMIIEDENILNANLCTIFMVISFRNTCATIPILHGIIFVRLEACLRVYAMKRPLGVWKYAMKLLTGLMLFKIYCNRIGSALSFKRDFNQMLNAFVLLKHLKSRLVRKGTRRVHYLKLV